MAFEIIDKNEEEHRIKEFKSLYYELNAKPDSTTKIYNDKVIVQKDDIERLYNLIMEKMALHVKEGETGISNVVVSTSKHKSYNFNDFKIFDMHGWDIAEYINNITISWDFFVNVDGYARPQRHKLTVKISCGLEPEEILSLLFSGRIEDIQEIQEQEATIIAQMDFIENRLGQEFINIVGEWVDTLTRAYAQTSHVVLFLKKYRKLVGYYFNYVLFAILSVTALFGFNYILTSINVSEINQISINHLQILVNYAVISILICWFTLKRGEMIANKIFRYLSEYGDTFVFRITRGDENQYNKITAQDKKNAVKIALNLIFSLFLNIGCGIIASILYNMI